MKNLSKAILLCAILSITFTPCFSKDTFTRTETQEALAHLPLAVPAEVADGNSVTPTSQASPTEVQTNHDNLPFAQSDTALNNEQESGENPNPAVESNFDADSKPVTDENNVNEADSSVEENVAESTDSSLETNQNLPASNETVSLVGSQKIAACPISTSYITQTGTVEAFKTVYKCLADKDLNAVMLEKGRKFEVKSLHPMSYKSSSGSEVMFESIYPERIFLSKDPVKLIFKGEVIKNKPPGKGGSSGTLKVQITGIKIGSVTYPAEAYISKMNKKGVMFGAVAGPSRYKDNLSDIVNNGTINNYYNMDPCDKLANECVNAVAKPFYLITGAALQTADLFLAPIIAFFAPGNEVYIPEGTEFEIKLEGDVPVLEI